MRDLPNWLPSTREAFHALYRRALAEANGQDELQAVFHESQAADFAFFVMYVLEFDDFRYLDNDWVFAKCREIQREPWGFLDLWARAHYKTTLLTVAYSIWEVCNNPELTYGIFSMTSGLAKKIGTQIKRYLEKPHLAWVFPDSLYPEPASHSPGWSVDGGLMLKRKGNPRESTFEFFGLENLPTGRHFARLKGDDIVDQTYATNPAMVEKAVNLIQLLTPLQTPDAEWGLAGTRYDNADAYGYIIEQGTFRPRIYTPTANGQIDGQLVLFSEGEYRKWMAALGPYHAACQLFQKPQALSLRQLDPAWIKSWDPSDGWDRLNRYLIVDPASKKGKANDYTAMIVVGLGDDGNVYVIDMVRDRLGLQERGREFMRLVRLYVPQAAFYEGARADIDYIEERMGIEQFRVPLLEMSTSGRNKVAAIDRLQPLAAESHLYFPTHILYAKAEGGNLVDLFQEFLRDEWTQWPKPKHDDMMDALARTVDGSEPRIVFPRRKSVAMTSKAPAKRYDPATRKMV